MRERILIVDDDASFRRVVEYSLHEEGYEWNQTRAAKFLRITRNTLIYRMQKYGLSGKDAPSPADRMPSRYP